MESNIPEGIKQKLVAAGEAAGRAAAAITIDEAKTALDETAAAYASVAGDVSPPAAQEEEVDEEEKREDEAAPVATAMPEGITDAERAVRQKTIDDMPQTNDTEVAAVEAAHKLLNETPTKSSGGKKKKRRGGKSHRIWKKNKKGGRQSKKRR